MKTRLVALGLAALAVAPVLARATPQDRIPALVMAADIEGVKLGMTRDEATVILVGRGYAAKPESQPGPGRGGTARVPGPLCSDPTKTGSREFSQAPSGGRLYANVQIAYQCSDLTVTQIERKAHTGDERVTGTTPVTALPHYDEVAPVYETLCPRPAAAVVSGRTVDRLGTVADLDTGYIECSGMQTRISVRAQKEEGGKLYDYRMGVHGYTGRAEFTEILRASTGSR